MKTQKTGVAFYNFKRAERRLIKKIDRKIKNDIPRPIEINSIGRLWRF